MKRRFLLIFLLTLGLWGFVHSVAIIVDGFTDELAKVDVIVVLGNQVNDDGSPSDRLRSRLDRAAELYSEGYAEFILLSGGIDPENGRSEAQDMGNYLESKGIPLANMLYDEQGTDTFETAVHTKQLIESQGWDSVLAISNYYHISRIQLAFSKTGIENVSTAHATMFPEWRDFYSIPREFFAYYYYLLRSYDRFYETEQFSLLFPRDWNQEGEGVFVNHESGGDILFSHVLGDFDAPIYEELKTERYSNSEGLVWMIHIYSVREEFRELYPESFRFAQIDLADRSAESPTFLYSYDEELNPDAVSQLEAILDSYTPRSQ